MAHPLFTRQPWRSPKPLPGSPVGMLGDQEAALFQAMAEEVFSGRGTIVDAGSFLGKSAFHFASGLRENPAFVPGRDKIHCFDIFEVVHSSTVAFFREHLGTEVRMGDSTRSVFERQVATVRDLLEVHEGDLHVLPWKRQPIEILMIDIAKSESLGRRVIELFFPDLIPGVSYVIHQDYHHAWHPYIHVAMSYLADYFEIVVARADASAAFFLRKEIPAEVLQRAIRHDFTDREKADLMDAAIARLPASDRPTIELMRLVTHIDATPAADFLAALSALQQRHADCATDAFWVREVRGVRNHLLEKDGWQQMANRRPDVALQRADELAAQGRREWSLLSLRGVALRALGRWEEAERDLHASLAANPHNCFTIAEYAGLLAERGRLDDAVTELERGLREPSATDADIRRCFDVLGVVFVKSGQVDWSLAVMERLRPSSGGRAEYWVLDARVHAHLGAKDRAARGLATAVGLGLPRDRRAEIESMLGLGAPQMRARDASE